jgi:hypothetical protein
VLLGVHRIGVWRAAVPWATDAPHGSKLVFIGRGLERVALRDDLAACLSPQPQAFPA